MRLVIVIVCLTALLVPTAVFAHRDVVCDGSKSIDIRGQREGIVQIKSTEPITGVYPATSQKAGLIQFDQENPKSIFRIDVSLLDNTTDIHVNTSRHQCVLRIWRVLGRYDTVVAVSFPPDQRELAAELPASLRQSPVRQIWFAIWLKDKAHAPAPVKVDRLEGKAKSWTEELQIDMRWKYQMPGWVGFTQRVTNTSDTLVHLNPAALLDPTRPIHSMTMTDEDNTMSLPMDGLIGPGKSVLVSVVYQERLH